MREHHFHRAKWLFFTICCILNSITGENSTPAWSKPEKSISVENNDWIPVQGKCLTCRANRDLDAQSTNELITKVLSPPAPQPSRIPIPSPQPTLKQQIQFPTQKQPRILPFGSNFPAFNSPFFNGDNKPYQIQSTKLYPHESQKQFYQYDTSSIIKQPYSLPPQQLIQQSPSLVQQQIPQQRFPGDNEPYPFTLPLKQTESTTPKVTYQPQIRFPDVEVPKLIPNNKITTQNTDEIQLLYVPVETLQRGRKTMKDQFPPPLQQNFLPPQYNLPYQTFQAQPESQFYFPQGYSPPPNFIQQTQSQPQITQQPQKSPETIQTTASKNILQPYFTINSVYNNVPSTGLQTLPPKQADLQFINLLQNGLINSNRVKPPEQQFKPPEQQFKQPVQIRPGQFELNNLPPGKAFIFQPNTNTQNGQAVLNDVYMPTTTEPTKTTQFSTEKTTFASKQPATKVREFEYQYVTNSPQTSASQNQQYVLDQNVPSLPKQIPQQLIPQFSQQHIPQTKLPDGYEDGNFNYPVPHQPPLSFYMEKLHNSKINDVLYLLKDAKTIPVLDAVENDTPQVFVGPSELQPPKGYIKFELPYLSSLDYNRIEKMIDRLPFFVAPLNFKPPPGYSKIPFPAPHIGSVVLSNSTAVHEALHGKLAEHKYRPTPPPFPSTEFSTTNVQLTSQINSFSDTPSSVSVGGQPYKNSFGVSQNTNFEQTFKLFPTITEEEANKPAVPTKITYKPPTTTEAPKRVINRQRKPIYRGYPTTTTEQITTQSTTTPEPIRKVTESVKDTDNYVEFSAKGNFNINDRNQAVPTKPVLNINSAFQQLPKVPSTSFQPPFDSDKTFDLSNFFSTFSNQQSPPKQNIQFPSTDFQNAPPPQDMKQFQEANSQFQNTQFQNTPSLQDMKHFQEINPQFQNNPSPQTTKQFHEATNTQFQNTPSLQNTKQFEEINPQFSNTKLLTAPQSNIQQQLQPPQFENLPSTHLQPSQNINFIDENSFQTSKQQSNDYFNPGGKNYPFFNPQQTKNEVTTETLSSQINTTQYESTNKPVNFNSVKSLSQYNPFSKNEEVTQNATEITTTSTTNQSSDSFASWNQQNQFYNANPAAVEFFSSPSSFPLAADTSIPAASETLKATAPQEITTSTYTPENIFGDSQRVSQSDFPSTESTEKPSTNGYRSRIKQRIQPSRYHHIKHTTEKENIDYQPYRGTSTKVPSTDYTTETSSPSVDAISQSTEYQPEVTTKHRRRRPIKQHINQQSVTTEPTATSTRGYRTRPNRYHTGSSTERYRARRPTTSTVVTALPETASSEWVGFGSSNFVPSAPASNEITPSAENQARIDDGKTYSKPVTQFWTEPRSQSHSDDAVPNSSTEDSLKTASPVQDTVQEVLPAWSDGQKAPEWSDGQKAPEWSDGQKVPAWSDGQKEPAWTDGKKFNLFDDQHYTPFVPTVQGQQLFIEGQQKSQNKSDDNVVERNDEHHFENKQVNNVVPQSETSEEVSSTSSSVVHPSDSTAESSVFPSEKTYDDQEIRKEKFLVKENVAGQKKVYESQDEKKVPGRRRGTWVRRIRVKRPQDVFETAESQNLGRLSENSLPTSDSKTLSKTEEKRSEKDESVFQFQPSSTSDDFVIASTESQTEREEIRTTTTENNDYANLQNNFAQMLSDFLNSNDQSTKTVHNIERYNSTENSISFVLGLDKLENTENASNYTLNTFITNSPTETTVVPHVEDTVTVTNYPSVNTEIFEHQTTTEELSDTVAPNNKLIGTSTTTEISLETEICYRGKCVKTKKSKASDLLPVE